MKLKHYQEKALSWLARYYQRCRALHEMGDRFPVSTAFTSITAEIFGSGLPYSAVTQLPGIPYVCIRIPTGGGKTVVGCEAIPIAQKELLRTDHSLVLWLVPSDAIRKQTLDRLRDRSDPYRISLETNLQNVEVLDIDEALSMTRATLDGATVIVVATMQAFRRKDTAQLKVYENSGALLSHFEELAPELKAALEVKPDGHFDRSLANVFRLRRPFVIVDEAHNARQPLAFETLKRLNPCGILELTATPNTKRETVTYEGEQVENPPSNILVSVSAYALKAEEMIKLPIYLRYREPWEALLGDAIGLLNHLKEEAEKERAEAPEPAKAKYIRPIMLLQAQPEYKEKASITVQDVKRTLLEQFHIPEEEIAVQTGEIRDLEKPENLDILSPKCRVRYVITVQALKEGWDCPFAYVLFSVAELSSGRAVEQILGRVLRMPHAARKRREALNGSYAFVASTRFDAAAKALKEGLIEAGFEKQEAADLVVEPTLPLEEETRPSVPTAPVTVSIPTAPSAIPLQVIESVTWDAEAKTLRIDHPLTDEQETALVAAFPDAKAKQIVIEASRRRAGKPAPLTIPRSPSQQGVKFEVPVLALKQADFLKAFESDDIEDRMNWSVSEANADLPSFFIPTEQRGIRIDITDAEKLQQEFIPINDAQRLLLETSAAWPTGQLVHWIDRAFGHPDLTEAEMGIYLTRLVSKLIDEKKIDAEHLTAHRHRLAKAVAEKVRELRKEARRQVVETLLFGEASAAVHVDAAATHTFDPAKYPYTFRYSGLELPKHYYEVIGDLQNSGEEYDCARVIAHLDNVEFWVRNLDGEPHSSFWIQTSSDKFYPDFVCRLKNGKTLVVEYKGSHLADNADSLEKERLGQLWAARSGGLCLFRMIKSPGQLGELVELVRKEGQAG